MGGQLGDERGDAHDSFRTERLDAGMCTAAQHMVASIIVAAERTWVWHREARFDGEFTLGAMYIPVVGEFGKSGSKWIGCLESVVPEPRAMQA